MIPSDISGLTVWVKGDAGVFNDAGSTPASNNQTVQQWSDQSGNSHHLSQATSGNRPTYKTNVLNGLPVVQFTASRPDYISTSFSTSIPCTAMVLARTTGGTNARVMATVSDNSLLGWWNGGRQQSFQWQTVKLDGVPAADTNWWYYACTIDNVGPTAVLYENGITITSATNALFKGWNGVSMGGFLNSENSDCQVAECIVYNTAISTINRESIEIYLADKWGLTVPPCRKGCGFFGAM